MEYDTLQGHFERKLQTLHVLLEVSEDLEKKVEEAKASEIHRLLNRREELIRLMDDMDKEIAGMRALHPFLGAPLPKDARDKISAVFVRLRSMLLRLQDLDSRSSSAMLARRDEMKSRLSGMRQRLRVSHSYSKGGCPPAKFLDVRK